MNILIKRSSIQFKSPVIGQPTKRIEEHFYKRNIVATIDGGIDRTFSFTASELSLGATEDEMIMAIKNKINSESESA